MSVVVTYKDKSCWLTTRDYEPGPPLVDSVDVDIAVLEADVVGYGASGRNA